MTDNKGDNKKTHGRHTNTIRWHQLGWKAPAGKVQRLRVLNLVTPGYVGAKRSSRVGGWCSVYQATGALRKCQGDQGGVQKK